MELNQYSSIKHYSGNFFSRVLAHTRVLTAGLLRQWGTVCSRGIGLDYVHVVVYRQVAARSSHKVVFRVSLAFLPIDVGMTWPNTNFAYVPLSVYSELMETLPGLDSWAAIRDHVLDGVQVPPKQGSVVGSWLVIAHGRYSRLYSLGTPLL